MSSDDKLPQRPTRSATNLIRASQVMLRCASSTSGPDAGARTQTAATLDRTTHSPFTPKAAGMLGTTWSRTLNGALDHIATQHACMSNALDDIGQFLIEHPEHDTDPHLTAARIALL